MATKQFWFVWNPAGRAPTYRHPSLVSAKTEADRLAALNPGQEFVVLQSVGIPGGSVAIILGIDRVLDMCRTVLNVTGDLLIAVLVARSEGRRLHPAPGGAS